MNAPLVEDMVEVQCSCGRFHRLPTRIREFRCACHMTIGVNIEPYISTEFIAPLPTHMIQPNLSRLPGLAPAGFGTPAGPSIQAPSRPLPRLPAPADAGWKNEMLDVMERVAELEDELHAQQKQLERARRELLEAQAELAEANTELEERRAQELQFAATLEQVKPIVNDWELLERENAKLCRAMRVARERGRVDVMDLVRRARSLKQMDIFR